MCKYTVRYVVRLPEKECKLVVFVMVCVAIKVDIGRHNGVMKLLADV